MKALKVSSRNRLNGFSVMLLVCTGLKPGENEKYGRYRVTVLTRSK